MMPDRNGKMESVVWEYDSLDSLMNSEEAYLSVLIGLRNRIQPENSLDGKQYNLLSITTRTVAWRTYRFHKRIRR